MTVRHIKKQYETSVAIYTCDICGEENPEIVHLCDMCGRHTCTNCFSRYEYGDHFCGPCWNIAKEYRAARQKLDEIYKQMKEACVKAREQEGNTKKLAYDCTLCALYGGCELDPSSRSPIGDIQ